MITTSRSLQHGEWSRKLAQTSALGSWLIMVAVIFGIICDSKFSYLSCLDLFMFSLSLAIIGFVTGVEVIRNSNSGLKPEQEGMAEAIVILSTVSSGMLVLGLIIFLVTSDFL